MLNLGINLIEFKKDYAGGINTYTLELIEELEKKNLKINIFTNKNSSEFLKKKFQKSNIITFNKNKFVILVLEFFCIILNLEKLFCLIENYYYQNIKKIIETNCDVFYCPLSYLKPYNLNIATISSPHDFQHLHFPEFFSYLRLRYRKMAFNLTIKKSNLIQASSNFIKKDINKKFITNKKKIILINEGVSNKFNYIPINFKENNYIFFPAQLSHHKNHMTVLNSLKLVYDKYKINFKLILVGEKFSAYNNISNFIKKNKELNIIYLGKVSFKKLLNLYKNCRFLISPSLHESSSLPILEACKIGRPVICSSIAPNKELSKKLKLNIFESENSINLSEILISLWYNKKLINNQINFNIKAINHFNWSKISEKYYKIFHKLNKKKKTSTNLYKKPSL
jgi:hypothetical protein